MLNEPVIEFYNKVHEESYAESLENIPDIELIKEFESLNDLYESSDMNYTKLSRLIELVRTEMLQRMNHI